MNKKYWDYKNITELLNLYEFEIVVNNDLSLSLVDLQGGNLGNIESESFKDFDEIIERLDIYHYDYIVRALEEEFNISENDFNDWKDMYNHLKNKTSWDIDILGLIVGGVIYE